MILPQFGGTSFVIRKVDRVLCLSQSGRGDSAWQLKYCLLTQCTQAKIFLLLAENVRVYNNQTD